VNTRFIHFFRVSNENMNSRQYLSLSK